MKMSLEREILGYIGQHEGEIGFYHISRKFGLPDAAYDLPAIVESMVKEELVKVTNAGDGTNERYRLTDKGHRILLG